MLLPTPDSGSFNDGQSVEAWRARGERMEAKHGAKITMTHGTPLAMALTLLREDSPASPSAPQDDEKARTTTDTSGPSSVASSLKFDPATWSSRTSLVCSLQDDAWVIEQASLFGTTPLATFSETFPRWGSMHDGRVFAHPTPERVTSESGSSSLHTPTTGDTAPTYDHRASPGYTRAIPVPNLAAQVDDLLPTPRGRDKGTAGDVSGLGDDGRAEPDGNGAFAWGPYEAAIRRWERVTRPAPHPVDDKGRLAPSFVEWMQGFPAGWTDGMTRTQALKALGNAVVSQQAILALSMLAPQQPMSEESGER
jgi:hypothetical protein